MAITHIGHVGQTASRDTNRFLTITVDRTIPAGRFLVCWYADQQIYSIFQPSDGNVRWKVVDDANNFWCAQGGSVYTNAFWLQGPAAIVQVCQLRRTLTAGDEITVLAQNLFADPTAKAMNVEEFDLGGSNKRFAVATDLYGGNETRNADPPNMSHGTMPIGEWLGIHCMSMEAPNTDTITHSGTATWNQITKIGTNTGTPTNDITLSGCWRIETETGWASSNYANSTTTRDNNHVVTAFASVPARPFPLIDHPVLDNFNRADEYPLNISSSTIPWNTTEYAWFGANGSLTSNQSAQPGGSKLDVIFTGCQEIYAQVTAFSQTTDLVHLHFMADGNSTSPVDFSGIGLGCVASNWDNQAIDGYTCFGHSGIQGGMGGNDSSPGHPKIKCWKEISAGDWIGLQRGQAPADYPTAGGIIHGFFDIGDDWEIFGSWLQNAGDKVSGNPAVAHGTTNSRLDNLAGGEINCEDKVDMPKIIRRPTTR